MFVDPDLFGGAAIINATYSPQENLLGVAVTIIAAEGAPNYLCIMAYCRITKTGLVVRIPLTDLKIL